MDFEIIVVASENRKALILGGLEGVPHQVSITPNYDLPENFVPKVKGMVHNHSGAYRCFKGHQQALSLSRSDTILILEDDAVPNIPSWIYAVSNAVPLLDIFDMVSFHGRQYDPSNFEDVSFDSEYMSSPCTRPWIVAALAYMVSRRYIEKLLSYEYEGMPWDILLYWNSSFCVQKKSIFNHDRSEGSLIDV